MPHPNRRKILRVATAMLVAGLPASAAETRVGDIVVSTPWTRASTGRVPAVGYMTISNTGARPDRLLGGETPQARAVELHRSETDGGVARMRPIEGGLAIAPKEVLRLDPDSGIHLMLVDPRGAFARGTKVPLTLVFEQAGRIQVELDVAAAGARAPGAHQGH